MSQTIDVLVAVNSNNKIVIDTSKSAATSNQQQQKQLKKKNSFKYAFCEIDIDDKTKLLKVYWRDQNNGGYGSLPSAANARSSDYYIGGSNNQDEYPLLQDGSQQKYNGKPALNIHFHDIIGCHVSPYGIHGDNSIGQGKTAEGLTDYELRIIFYPNSTSSSFFSMCYCCFCCFDADAIVEDDSQYGIESAPLLTSSMIDAENQQQKVKQTSKPKILNATGPRRRMEISFIIRGDSNDAKSVAEHLRLSILKSTLNPISYLPDGVRRLLIFVNPRSGPGKALQIFQGQVLPLFLDAGIELHTIVTERQNHASEFIKDCNDLMVKYHGIVIVSGDGLVYEVLQGMLSRPDWAKVVRHMPIGVIPGGSGNGLAHTVADAAEEHHDALHNAFVIAKGFTSPMDICVVERQDGQRSYSFLSVEFGFVADIDIESETLRWMGDARFTVYAVKLLMTMRKNIARLSYLPVPQYEQDMSKLRTPKSSGISSPQSFWELDDAEGGALSSGTEPKTRILPPISQPVPQNWKTIEDRFYFMWNTNCKWMAADANIAPDSTLNDGFIQLTYLRKNGPHGGGSRLKMLNYLLGLAEGSHVTDHAIEMTPVQAYRIEPLAMHKDSKIAIDGEMIPVQPIQLEILRGFAKVFAPSLD